MKSASERLSIFHTALSLAVIFMVTGCAMSGTRESVPVELSGHYAVPDEVRTSATGTATIEVTANGGVAGSVWVQNVAATAVEIGEGPVGSNGPVIASLVKIGDNTWTVPGGVRLTAAQYESFMAGNLYVNVRSAAHPGGEIRGQITPAACRIKLVETEPVVAPPPPPPLPKITYSADALFDFDKATLKTEGKTKLDDLVNELRNAQYKTIHVTGYTDRIGSDAYNQNLSVRRAEAVKHYLADKGVPADQIDAEGRGKSDPVTQPGDCKGKKRKDMIDCLQADRRVEVEVK